MTAPIGIAAPAPDPVATVADPLSASSTGEHSAQIDREAEK